MKQNVLRNPAATDMRDLGVADMMEWVLGEALASLGQAEALETKLPGELAFDVGGKLSTARQALEAALKLLAGAGGPDGAAPAGAAKNVPQPIESVGDLIAISRAA